MNTKLIERVNELYGFQASLEATSFFEKKKPDKQHNNI